MQPRSFDALLRGRLMTLAAIRIAVVVSIVGALVAVGVFYDAWQRYATDHQHDAVLTEMVESRVGYGGLIHNFSNYIFRGDRHVHEVETDIAALHALAEQMKGHHQTRLRDVAIEKIGTAAHSLEVALDEMSAVPRAERDPREDYAKVAPSFVVLEEAIAGLATLTSDEVEGPTTFARELRELERSMGIGGMISHVKAFFIMGDEADAEEALTDIAHAREHLAALTPFLETKTELLSRSIIEDTLVRYVELIEKARDLYDRGASPREVEAATRVDDRDAIGAYWTLRNAVIHRIDDVADAMPTAVYLTVGLLFLALAGSSLPFLITYFRSSRYLRAAIMQTGADLARAGEIVANQDFDTNLPIESLPEEFRATGSALSRIRQKDRQLISQRDALAAKAKALEKQLGMSETSNEALKEDLSIRESVWEEQQEAAERTARKAQLLGSIMNTIDQSVLAFDSNQELMFWNHRASEHLNIPEEWLERRQSAWDMVLYMATRGDFGPGTPWDIAKRVMRDLEKQVASGRLQLDVTMASGRVMELIGGVEKSGELVMTVTDITERYNSARDAEKAARTDVLTGLLNRFGFEELAQLALAESEATLRAMAFLSIDLDGFKPINDTYGHAAGDHVLAEIGARLAQEVRETDTAARMGGDEFCVALTRLDGIDGVRRFASRVLRSLTEPVHLPDGTQVVVGASIGAAVYPDHGEDMETLFHHADVALYAAKRAGKGRAHIYATPETERAAETASLVLPPNVAKLPQREGA